jgi:hypothetical protein
MTQLASARRLQPFELPIPSRLATPAKKTEMRTLDLIVVLGFCAIGLILTFALARAGFFVQTADIYLVP